MAAELTLPAGRIRERAIFRLTQVQVVSRRVVTICVVAVTLLTAVFMIAAIKAYFDYQDFAVLIDQQINAGYLKSHAGLYAAPRIIERGANLSKEQVVEALLRAGYAREQASNIWNGSFQTRAQSVLIFPRK